MRDRLGFVERKSKQNKQSRAFWENKGTSMLIRERET